DMFAVAVFFFTGKILYISDQAAFFFFCKRGYFKNAKFVEFLAPQDVSVFYTSTTLFFFPSWNICNRAESSFFFCMEEKSFFCRIRYFFFLKLSIFFFVLCPCCFPVCFWPEFWIGSLKYSICKNPIFFFAFIFLSAPRIPPDKRIFTTTHTPTCLFQVFFFR
ncbi:PER2 protein, partial [Prunella himalayana]|nr:PER2 protein [Prunella himalayana]